MVLFPDEIYSIIVESTKKVHRRLVRSAPEFSLTLVKKRRLRADISARSLLSTEEIEITCMPASLASLARFRVCEKEPEVETKIKMASLGATLIKWDVVRLEVDL